MYHLCMPRKVLILALALILPGCGGGGGSSSDAPEPVLFLGGFFPIGVWVPPAYDFEKWKGRNVNTMVGVTQDFEEWNAEANRLGLRMIRDSRPNPADDAGESLLLAWAQDDEPDGISVRSPTARSRRGTPRGRASMPAGPCSSTSSAT